MYGVGDILVLIKPELLEGNPLDLSHINVQALAYAMYAELPRLILQYPWQIKTISLNYGENEFQDKAFWEQTDNIGASPAHYASWGDNLALFERVVQADPKALDRVNRFGQNVAHYAAQSGKIDILRWILAKKPEYVTKTDQFGRAVLHYIVQSGQVASLEWFDDFEVEYKADTKGNFLIHLAAMSGCVDMLNYIFNEETGEDFFQTNNLQQTPTQIAVLYGNIEILNQPRIRNALSSNDAKVMDLMSLAAKSGRMESIKWVLSQFPELFVSEKDKQSAIKHASFSGSLSAIEWARLQDDKALELRDAEGSTVVHCAAIKGRFDTLKKFASTENVIIPNNREETPLHLAACSGNVDDFNVIYDHQINKERALRQAARFGVTLLHYSAMSANPAMIECVLNELYQRLPEGDFKIEVTCLDILNKNFLHHAAHMGNPEIFRQVFRMLSPRIIKELWVPDAKGNTPEAYAPTWMKPRPAQLMENFLQEFHHKLLVSLKAVINETMDAENISLLNEYKDIWFEILMAMDPNAIHSVKELIRRLPFGDLKMSLERAFEVQEFNPDNSPFKLLKSSSASYSLLQIPSSFRGSLFARPYEDNTVGNGARDVLFGAEAQSGEECPQVESDPKRTREERADEEEQGKIIGDEDPTDDSKRP